VKYLFRLDHSIGRDVGDYPQLAYLPKGYVDDSQDSIYELRNYKFEFPKEGTINFPLMKMERKAKLTDILSCVYVPTNGMVVSHRFMDFIASYNLENVKFYPCQILYKNEMIDYYWMHIIDLSFVDCNEIIDFRNSYIYDPKLKKKFLFKNMQEMKNYYDITRIYNINEFLKLNSIPKILFCIPYFVEILVAKELKEEIEKHIFTGITFEEIENLTLQ